MHVTALPERVRERRKIRKHINEMGYNKSVIDRSASLSCMKDLQNDD
jgi:hypothetical protein